MILTFAFCLGIVPLSPNFNGKIFRKNCCSEKIKVKNPKPTKYKND